MKDIDIHTTNNSIFEGFPSSCLIRSSFMISILVEPCNDLRKIENKDGGYWILLVEPSEHDGRECSQDNFPRYELCYDVSPIMMCLQYIPSMMNYPSYEL